MHDSTLRMDQVFLTYCIMAGLKVNVGRLFSSLPRKGVEKSKLRLIFPTVIHTLMTTAGVTKLTTDRISNDKMIIENKDVKRFLRNNTRLKTRNDPDKFVLGEAKLKSLRGEFKATLNSHRTLMSKQIDRQVVDLRGEVAALKKTVKSLHTIMLGWLKFEKSRDDANRMVLENEHPEVVSRMAPFPLHLLWEPAEHSPTLPE
ncbi:hypothetical protein L6452_40640 [Arctium lappa]|uniref:Uncharacterized protein n=1 Tax=Arctium lappa TaxID=4217 RepID=A0ACB8XMQ0_ARCLA|nr:hypothetical protein L6452_40640 [Arctium lappa]